MTRRERGWGWGTSRCCNVLVHDNGGGLVGHCCEKVLLLAALGSCSCLCAAKAASDAEEERWRVWCCQASSRQAECVEVQDYVSRAPNVGSTLRRLCQECVAGPPRQLRWLGKSFCARHSRNPLSALEFGSSLTPATMKESRNFNSRYCFANMTQPESHLRQ